MQPDSVMFWLKEELEPKFASYFEAKVIWGVESDWGMVQGGGTLGS